MESNDRFRSASLSVVSEMTDIRELEFHFCSRLILLFDDVKVVNVTNVFFCG